MQQTTLKEKLVLAVSLGIVLGLCVGILLYLVRKHPERAKKIIRSFVRKRVHWISAEADVLCNIFRHRSEACLQDLLRGASFGMG